MRNIKLEKYTLSNAAFQPSKMIQRIKIKKNFSNRVFTFQIIIFLAILAILWGKSQCPKVQDKTSFLIKKKYLFPPKTYQSVHFLFIKTNEF